jgi:hypothetical protein
VAGHQGPASPAEHEIHTAPPSISPPIIGLGVTILSFGVLFGLGLILLGGAILLVGLATWLVDDARNMLRAQQRDADGGPGAH